MRHIYTVLAAIADRGSQVCVQLWEGLTGLLRSGRWLLVLLALAVGLAGCSDESTQPLAIPLDEPARTAPAIEAARLELAEVSPPDLLQQLRLRFERYRPQVSILSPGPDSVIDSDAVTIVLNATGLPVFRNAESGLGPHLELLLDDRPTQAVFDTGEPITIEDLAPGTHTLRVFAVRPWSESFKNPGAFAQTTFHIQTKTPSRALDPTRPLLTYNQPSGTYGAEPVLLDFYLTNAPLHAIAQEFDDDEIRDWMVRVTLNGQSFLLDRWEPIYLTGAEPGQNWLRLELVDELGEPIVNNGFNSPVQRFRYDPELDDARAALIRGSIDLEAAIASIEPSPEPEEVTAEEAVAEPEMAESIEPLPESEATAESNSEDVVTEPEEAAESVEEDVVAEPEVEEAVAESEMAGELVESNKSDKPETLPTEPSESAIEAIEMIEGLTPAAVDVAPAIVETKVETEVNEPNPEAVIDKMSGETGEIVESTEMVEPVNAEPAIELIESDELDESESPAELVEPDEAAAIVGEPLIELEALTEPAIEGVEVVEAVEIDAEVEEATSIEAVEMIETEATNAPIKTVDVEETPEPVVVTETVNLAEPPAIEAAEPDIEAINEEVTIVTETADESDIAIPELDEAISLETPASELLAPTTSPEATVVAEADDSTP